MRLALSPRAAATVAALGLILPVRADTATKTQPKPPRFPGGAAPEPAETPVPPTPPGEPAPVPPTARVSSADATSGPPYEKQRIKRTVSLDPKRGLEGRWDRLYATGAGTERRAVYLDWDDDYLYLAAESADLAEVRFDVDARGDGWFRGADNIRITVVPTPGGKPGLATQRWDAVQNRNRAIWAASPIPAEEIRAAAGTTPGGTGAVLIAVPRTEAAGLERKVGAAFGLRVEWGPSEETEAALYAPRAMLALTLAEDVEARETATGLHVRADVSPRNVVPGGPGVKMTVEVRNEGRRPARIARLFVRGSQNAQAVLDAATFTGQVLMPGDKITRSFFSTVSGAAGLGTLVIAAGVEREDESDLSALAAFNRLDPFAVSLKMDAKPVSAGTNEQRRVLVSVTGRGEGRVRGRVTLRLPAGWSLEDGKPERGVSVSFAGETTGVYYKVAVPAAARPGRYPIRADVRIGGRAYAASGTLTVVGAGAADGAGDNAAVAAP